jgi:hypothetical protein
MHAADFAPLYVQQQQQDMFKNDAPHLAQPLNKLHIP